MPTSQGSTVTLGLGLTVQSSCTVVVRLTPLRQEHAHAHARRLGAGGRPSHGPLGVPSPPVEEDDF